MRSADKFVTSGNRSSDYVLRIAQPTHAKVCRGKDTLFKKKLTSGQDRRSFPDLGGATSPDGRSRVGFSILQVDDPLATLQRTYKGMKVGAKQLLGKQTDIIKQGLLSTRHGFLRSGSSGGEDLLCEGEKLVCKKDSARRTVSEDFLSEVYEQSSSVAVLVNKSVRVEQCTTSSGYKRLCERQVNSVKTVSRFRAPIVSVKDCLKSKGRAASKHIRGSKPTMGKIGADAASNTVQKRKVENSNSRDDGSRVKRMASLNALAKVHILYENEARSPSGEDKDSASDHEHPAKRAKEVNEVVCDDGHYKGVVGTKRKLEPFKGNEIVTCKRMASLNAQAIMTASYSTERNRRDKVSRLAIEYNVETHSSNAHEVGTVGEAVEVTSATKEIVEKRVFETGDKHFEERKAALTNASPHNDASDKGERRKQKKSVEKKSLTKKDKQDNGVKVKKHKKKKFKDGISCCEGDGECKKVKKKRRKTDKDGKDKKERKEQKKKRSRN